MKAFLCELLFTCVLGAPGTRGVDELAYGNMLYAYLQEDHEQALLEVMVADRRGRLGDDPGRFELATGSLAFAEGMYRMSDAAVAALEPGTLSDINQMRLAFHRARTHYRSGAWDTMAAALDSIRFDPAWTGRDRYHPEVQFMRAEAALAAGNFAAAEQALDVLADDEDWLGYGLFNLAVARRAAGDLDGAQATLARLADLPLESDVGRDLVARGRLGLAMAAHERAVAIGAAVPAEPDEFDAQAVLATLPAASRYREQALTAYGDLAMRQGDFRLAARIWLTLQQGGEWHSGRAAAGLGLPMALEGLNEPHAALAGYRRAADAFEARRSALEILAGQTSDRGWTGRLLEASLPAEPGASTPDRAAQAAAGNGAADLPGVAEALGNAAWLAWLADEDVNRLLREWQTFDRMSHWLDSLPIRLVALAQVKDERTRRSAAARAALAAQDLVERRDTLAADIQQLDTRVAELGDPARVPDEGFVDALADAGERKHLARLDRLSAALLSMPTTPAGTDSARLAARIARLRGVVLWQVAESRGTRVRTLVNELDDARIVLAGVDSRVARVERAEAELAAGVVADFDQLTARTTTLAARVAAGRSEREQAIAAAFHDALNREIARTDGYLMSAQIAIARTTDQLAAAGTPEGPQS